MTMIERYLRYIQELGEGTREAPEGMVLTKTEPLARAAELQEQIQAMGLVPFISLCAAQDGETLSEEEKNSFREEDLLAALQGALSEEAPQEEAQEDAPPQIDEPDGPRSAYEVLIDCCCLDEKLMYYLIDVLKRGAEEEFQKLALVTTRKAFTQADFLYWYVTKPTREGRDALVCTTVIDACFDRLASEGQVELIAALLSGDQTTFELFRCEAPELKHLPDATFAWYEENYLQGLYPLRYMLKFNGVVFPKEAEQ